MRRVHAGLRRQRRPELRHLIPDAGLGMIAALGLAPFDFWAATPLAFAVLLWRMARAPRLGWVGAAFWHALAAGTGWFALALVWIVQPFLIAPEIHGWMAPFALLLMALGGALFWALPVAAAVAVAPRWQGRVVAIAVALALSDWLRGWIFTGFPWALIGHGWIGTPVAQTASATGALGLSTLTLTLACLPALLWRRAGSFPQWSGLLPGCAAALLMLAVIWVAGLGRLDRPLPPDHATQVRIVQPNVPQARKWDPAFIGADFRNLLDLSAAPGAPDLVIWPETAVTFLLEDATGLNPGLVAASGGVPLIMGIQRRDEGGFYNSLVSMDAAGRVTNLYDKFHLVPFGEYIPWGRQLAGLGIAALAAQSGFGYTPGPGPQVLPGIGGAPAFQPLICYEAIFPQHLRSAATRPGWLLQITNDAWFGTFSGPWQHLAQARLRAIESGLPLIRVANTGVSAVIDARGEVRRHLPLDRSGTIDAALPAALPATPWMRWGDVPLLILLTAAGAAAAMTGRRR